MQGLDAYEFHTGSGNHEETHPNFHSGRRDLGLLERLLLPAQALVTPSVILRVHHEDEADLVQVFSLLRTSTDPG